MLVVDVFRTLSTTRSFELLLPCVDLAVAVMVVAALSYQLAFNFIEVRSL
jgi:hypothetical protein